MFVLIREGYCNNTCNICNISLWPKDTKYTEIDNYFVCIECWNMVVKILKKKRDDEIKQIINDIKNNVINNLK